MTTFLDEQEQAGISGPRASKEKGDKQWCWQTISHLQTIWKSLDLDYKRYLTTWEEAEEYKVWEQVPYETPFGSKEEMLKQLAIGDDTQAKQRIDVQPIAARVRRLHRHLEDPRGKDFRRGTNPDYILLRLLHDNPDIFERWERGEFPNAAAAAAEAGLEWVKRSKTLTLSKNIERVADRLRAHYTPDELQRIRDRLSDESEAQA